MLPKSKMTLVIGTVIVLGIACYFLVIFRTGELGEKELWSILQGTEFQHRNDVDNAKVLILERVNNSKFTIIGIPTNDAKVPRAWLALNATDSDGSIMIMPDDTNPKIRCATVAEIKERLRIEPAVLNYLQNICEKT